MSLAAHPKQTSDGACRRHSDNLTQSHLQSRQHRRSSKSRLPWTAIVLAFACLLSFATAQAAHMTAPPAAEETLLVDTGMPLMGDDQWTMTEENAELRRRQETVSSLTTTLSIVVSSSTETPSKPTDSPPKPLPSPFDKNMAANFTAAGCPTFINKFLVDPNFKKCYPISMLLQGSRSFFEAHRSLVATTQMLDASCVADVGSCAAYLSGLARSLTDAANCAEDYALGNPVVVQAYIGLISYEAVYAATCLRDPVTGSYCFANAVTNLTSNANVYFYYLPANISVGDVEPSCDWCLSQTMAIFQSASANRRLPIANTYIPAAKVVDSRCGPGFANVTLPVAINTNAGLQSASVAAFWPVWIAATTLAIQWLL